MDTLGSFQPGRDWAKMARLPPAILPPGLSRSLQAIGRGLHDSLAIGTLLLACFLGLFTARQVAGVPALRAYFDFSQCCTRVPEIVPGRAPVL